MTPPKLFPFSRSFEPRPPPGMPFSSLRGWPSEDCSEGRGYRWHPPPQRHDRMKFDFPPRMVHRSHSVLDYIYHLTLELTPDCTVGMGARKEVGQAAKIGQVAQETGLSIDTIRFYEKQGLLKRSRTECGFRLFGISDIEALKFVRNAQDPAD